MSIKEQLSERFEALFACLVYDSEIEKKFSTPERILINQERGSLFDQINALTKNRHIDTVRDYKVPESIEHKIAHCLSEIERRELTTPISVNWNESM